MVAPFDSLEVRWFFEGALSESAPTVAAWFRARAAAIAAAGGELARPEDNWRRDEYLMTPCGAACGLKYREGRLEFKGRVCDFGRHRFAGDHVGLVERWMKWSCEEQPPGAAADAGWLGAGHGLRERIVAVEKNRILCALALDGVPLQDAHVNAELTRLRVPPSPREGHWTLAFESPYEPDLRGPFARRVAEFLAEWPLQPLAATRSTGYPAWLLAASGQARSSPSRTP